MDGFMADLNTEEYEYPSAWCTSSHTICCCSQVQLSVL